MGRGCHSTSDEVKALAGQDDVPTSSENLVGFTPHPWHGLLTVSRWLHAVS
jgi:hypothetical protein